MKLSKKAAKLFLVNFVTILILNFLLIYALKLLFAIGLLVTANIIAIILVSQYVNHTKVKAPLWVLVIVDGLTIIFVALIIYRFTVYALSTARF